MGMPQAEVSRHQNLYASLGTLTKCSNDVAGDLGRICWLIRTRVLDAGRMLDMCYVLRSVESFWLVYLTIIGVVLVGLLSTVTNTSLLGSMHVLV